VWGEVFVLLGLGALLVGSFLVLRRRRTDPVSGGVETLTEAISQSLDDLRVDPDPRRAIVAAYARMERALAASGVPRRPAEAPHEYLERALLAVDASAGAARRLTELFERAKFSQHEPDAGMRDEAIAALEAIRDELAAGSEIAA
jgi:LPXTG-motif cell wall-anchored protein